MRKLFAGLLIGIGLLFAGANINPAQSAQVANVEYIHLLIKQEWGIEVPYYPENAKLVANMEYLLMVVDRANLMLNGEATSSYASDPVYATKQAVDTIAVNQAVETLIKKQIKPEFYITTTPDNSSFSFTMSAYGSFSVDWGDGDVEMLSNPGRKTYTHTYSSAKEYTIRIAGSATLCDIEGYGDACISFANNKNIAGISGSLGAIFKDAQRVLFNRTFINCTNLKGSIPEDLFKPTKHIDNYYWKTYQSTFSGCSGLTGEIPLGLFGDIVSSSSMSDMFYQTFYNCSGLTGPSARMPDGTYLYDAYGRDYTDGRDMYYGATGLEDYPYIPQIWGGLGQIKPDFLITTTPDTSSFSFKISAAGDFTIDWGDGDVETINKTNTTNTTYSHTYDKAGEYKIGISGEATAYNTEMFPMYAAISFSGNTNTAGISGSLGAIFGTLADGTNPRFINTFSSNSNLTGEIPADLFAGISGAPATYMFSGTFEGCSGLTGEIPADLFAELSSITTTVYCFYETFKGCSGLSSIGGPLFENLANSSLGQSQFEGTFADCSGLKGEIPLGLFGNIHQSFSLVSAFSRTFYNCSGLTGPSARMPDGTYLYDFFTGATASGMYRGATGLSDYDSIPDSWK